MVKAAVSGLSAQIEDAGMAMVTSLDSSSAPISQVTKACEEFQQEASMKWQQLYQEILVRFADGWDYDGIEATALGYPAWWLAAVDYHTPINDRTCHPTCN